MSARKRSASPLAAALVCLGLSSLGLLGACASEKPRPPAAEAPRPEPPATESLPWARLDSGRELRLDQHRLRLPFVLVLENPGKAAASLVSMECRLFVEGDEASGFSLKEATTVAGGSSLSLPFELGLDTRDLDSGIAGREGPAEPAWTLEGRLVLVRGGGSRLELPLSAEGSFPLIREPSFSIASIKIERDLLVTTQLALGLEIHNPNAFPIELRSFEYDFYGEGRLWANGISEDAAMIAARGSLRRGLRFTMNFADMDRRLFDLVAKLKTVRYRLAGEARIATGLEYLPAFTASFDREGSCAVDR